MDDSLRNIKIFKQISERIELPLSRLRCLCADRAPTRAYSTETCLREWRIRATAGGESQIEIELPETARTLTRVGMSNVSVATH